MRSLRSLLGASAALALASTLVCTRITTAAPMVTIDFETAGTGSPSVETVLSADEYASQGVTITSDKPVFLAENVNIGTSKDQGFYIFAGASVSSPDTFIDLVFDPGIVSVDFDWHSSTEGLTAEISVFGPGDMLLGTFSDATDSTFIVEGSHVVYLAGHFSLDLGGTEIRRIRVEDQPVGVHTLAIDNLSFTQVPEPSTGLLLGFGLVGLAVGQRRSAL